MGGQIRRGRIWRFWGAPIFSPEVPKCLFLMDFGASGRKIGADLTPHLRPSERKHHLRCRLQKRCETLNYTKQGCVAKLSARNGLTRNVQIRACETRAFYPKIQ